MGDTNLGNENKDSVIFLGLAYLGSPLLRALSVTHAYRQPFIECVQRCVLWLVTCNDTKYGDEA